MTIRVDHIKRRVYNIKSGTIKLNPKECKECGQELYDYKRRWKNLYTLYQYWQKLQGQIFSRNSIDPVKLIKKRSTHYKGTNKNTDHEK